VILVEDGKLIARLQQGVESLDDVTWAVLERSGSISIVKKE
jgi:uncharacterized membrane protein YcaP (DUF421 family)